MGFFERLGHLESDLELQDINMSKHSLNLRLERMAWLRLDTHFNLYAATAFITPRCKIVGVLNYILLFNRTYHAMQSASKYQGP